MFATALGVLEGDETLEVETSLRARREALEFIAQAERSSDAHLPNADFARRLAALKKRLLAVDTQLFGRLRTQIQAGNYTPDSLRREFDPYTDYARYQKGAEHIGLDGLDILLNGILEIDIHSQNVETPDLNQIYYRPTPARAILDLLDNIGLQPDDVFYDIGSGLGQAVILAHLVSGVKAKGVEIDPARYDCACRCAGRLRLSGVEFILADARSVDYADGAIFFMYTPFQGETFQAVLEQLYRVSRKRPIRLAAYGVCTFWAAAQPWFQSADANADSQFKVAIFRSR